MHHYRLRYPTGVLVHGDLIQREAPVLPGDYVEGGPVTLASTAGGIFRVDDVRVSQDQLASDLVEDIWVASITHAELDGVPEERIHRFYSPDQDYRVSGDSDGR